MKLSVIKYNFELKSIFKNNLMCIFKTYNLNLTECKMFYMCKYMSYICHIVDFFKKLSAD